MKQLLVLSGKGGTGKTTVSAGLIQLAKATAVADCDVDAPNLHLVLNQSGTPLKRDFMGGDKARVEVSSCNGCGICKQKCRFNAISLLEGKAVVSEFSCEGCGVCTYVCPSGAISLVADVAGECKLYSENLVFSTATLKMGRGNSGKLVSQVKQAMQKSASECDLAIVDGSPGIGCPVMASASGVDLVLVVAEPSESGISDLKRLLEMLSSFGMQVLVCVNKFDISHNHTLQIEDICKRECIPFVGKIPFDKEAVRAINNGNNIADINCPAMFAIEEMFGAIMNYVNNI